MNPWHLTLATLAGEPVALPPTLPGRLHTCADEPLAEAERAEVLASDLSDAEAALLLGITRQRVNQLRRAPDPLKRKAHMKDDALTAATNALMRATLQASGVLLDLIPPSSRPAIDRALAGGARLLIEVGLPDADRFALVLVEREGRRQALHSVSLRASPEQ